MRVIYKTKLVQREIDYPNADIAKPIENINKAKLNGKFVEISKDSDEWIDLYFIEETFDVNPDQNKYDLIRQPDILTTKVHPTYSHLKICERKWILQEKSQQEIISRLNFELGNYLDSEYPVYKRDKDLRLISFSKEKDANKLKLIQDLDTWMDTCRSLRDARELNYVNNGVFPEFGNYPAKPVLKTIK